MKQRSHSLTCIHLAALLAAASASFAPTAGAVVSDWTFNGAGNWTAAANWTAGVPNAPGDTANFTNDITVARIISLNGDKTVGALVLGDPFAGYFAFTINSGTASGATTSKLIFDSGGPGQASVRVPDVGGVAANNVSAFGVLLRTPLTITTELPNSTVNQLSIASIIDDGAGAFGLTKAGPGILQLSGANTFKGGTTVNNGRVNANSLTAFGSGGVTVASGGLVFINTASSAASFSLAGTGYASTADTAAQAGALRLANNRAVFGNVTIAAPARLGVNAADVGSLLGNLLGAASLEINGPTTTTGIVNLLGSAAGYSGTLSLARGSLYLNGPFGGSLAVTPAAGANVTLGAGTTVTGSLSLDSSVGTATFRNPRGTLAIGGNLDLTGSSAVSPATFPTPGMSSLTLMTYAAKTGAGTLTFDATGYRGAPAVSVGATSAVISGLDTKSLTWNNATFDGVWNVNGTADWTGGDTKFFQGDAVVFNDSGSSPVTLEGTLRPQSVTFNTGLFKDYTLSGSGVIDGAGGGIIKNGAGTVTLGGTNTFTGPVLVNEGRLSLGSPGALGYTPTVTVASGASLDINGQRPLQVSRSVDVTIAGTGDGVIPALANFGPTIAFAGSPATGIRNVTLAGDATIGGFFGSDFDIYGELDGAGHTLTKAGGNSVILMGPSKNLHTVITEGTLGCFNTDGFGASLRVEGGATARAASAGIYSSAVTLGSGARLELLTGVETLWTGPITAEGDVELVNGNTTTTSLTLAQGFDIPGNLTKSGGGNATLLGNVNVAGDASITGGWLSVGNGSTANTLLVHGPNGTGSGTVIVNAGATLGGLGALPVTVTVNSGATLAPGTSTIKGTLTTGFDSPNRTTTINGKLRVKCGGTTTDKLAAGGTLTLGAASILELSPLGGPLTAPAYVIAAYTTLIGTFGTVTGLPEGYELVYGYDDGSSANNVALVKTQTYAEWIEGFFPGETDPTIVGRDADPDRDGIPNLTENYLGTSPNAPSAGLTQTYVLGGSLFFQHTRADAPLSGYTASYEWSMNLADWHASDATASDVTVSITSYVLVDNPAPQSDVIQVVASVVAGTANQLYVRLVLTPR
jgi:fibronectin-binding autotransporter adhesin